ncbi:MAG: response regulator [Bacillales bacterium]|nr:response regulator [Bacillales bacterium]MDY6141801.1 response regulator [Bacilli bacterium]
MKNKIIYGTVNFLLLALITTCSLVNFSGNFIVVILGAFLLVGFNILSLFLMKKNLAIKVEKAEKENLRKSDFLFAMSHSIRTPMNAVVGMTKIARDHIEDKNIVNDCLRKIDLSGRNLVSLVNDIIDFSKVEKGKYQLSNSVFSIEEQLEYIKMILGNGFEEKGIKVTFDTTKAKYDSIFTDELRLNQILLTIINNAIDYNRKDGLVNVVVEEIEIPNREDKVDLVYKISDTGIGMSKEFIARIFDPYSREVDTRIDRVNGSGLGLAISKNLIDLLGGTIEVKSEVGKGSEFTVKLEVEIGGNVIHKEEEKDTIKFKNMHILAVEDNELNYEILSKTLEQYGITMDHAENGEQAVEIMSNAKPNQYKLILMDIEMPKMNGYEATRAIRKLENAKVASTPIYALTADAFSEDIKKAKEAGMNGHISKPVDFNKVIAVIKKNK